MTFISRFTIKLSLAFALASVATTVWGDVLLDTDFTGRTVGGTGNATASTITWLTSGFEDPGDMTAVPVGGGTFGGLFDTANAQGHFAPDRNTNNEGNWSTDIALTVTPGKEVTPENIVLDWQHFSNSGGFQSGIIDRPTDWTATITGSLSGVIDSVMDTTGSGGAGMLTLNFTPGLLLDTSESYTLTLEAGPSAVSGNNTGLDALTLNGLVADAVVPEPASIAIWSLIGLGLAGFGYYRTRRKK